MRRMPQVRKNDLNIIIPRLTGDAKRRSEMKTDETSWLSLGTRPLYLPYN